LLADLLLTRLLTLIAYQFITTGCFRVFHKVIPIVSPTAAPSRVEPYSAECNIRWWRDLPKPFHVVLRSSCSIAMAIVCHIGWDLYTVLLWGHTRCVHPLSMSAAWQALPSHSFGSKLYVARWRWAAYNRSGARRASVLRSNWLKGTRVETLHESLVDRCRRA